jgi:hypothetical protein
MFRFDFKVKPPEAEERCKPLGSNPQWDNRSGRSTFDVSRENEMINNSDYVIGGISSQKIF